MLLNAFFRQFSSYVLPQEFVAIEPFLEGNYQKFNSNGGYECWENVSSLLPAFCHWTWHVSGHKYMVRSSNKMLVSKETLVLGRWEKEKNLVLSKRLIKVELPPERFEKLTFPTLSLALTKG